jgi:Cu/Ag efflux pump CusA
MTSFSVVAGNMPLALALDPGSISRSSLGIVVIGGVLSSLVLTLLADSQRLYVGLTVGREIPPRVPPGSAEEQRQNGRS